MPGIDEFIRRLGVPNCHGNPLANKDKKLDILAMHGEAIGDIEFSSEMFDKG